MKWPSCSVCNGIAAVFVGAIVCWVIAEDTSDVKQTPSSRRPLEFRPYFVSPGALKSLIETQGSSSHATNAPGKQTSGIAGDEDIRKFFVDAGVPFPEGSFVTYNE